MLGFNHLTDEDMDSNNDSEVADVASLSSEVLYLSFWAGPLHLLLCKQQDSGRGNRTSDG